MDNIQYSELESGVSFVKDEDSNKKYKGYYFVAIILVFVSSIAISATISYSLHLVKKSSDIFIPHPPSLESIFIPGYTNSINLYIPSDFVYDSHLFMDDNYTDTRAPRKGFILLHDGGCSKEQISSTVNISEAWSTQHNIVVAVPQGKSIQKCMEAPKCKANTWSDYIMDSGSDDYSFLLSLSSYLREEYEVLEVYIIGFGNGGMMAKRMWCQAAKKEVFDGYFSFAGPASAVFESVESENKKLCPGSTALMHSIFSNDDKTIGATMDAHIWTISWSFRESLLYAYINKKLINEIIFWQNKVVNAICGKFVSVKYPTRSSENILWYEACDKKAVVGVIDDINYKKQHSTTNSNLEPHKVGHIQYNLGGSILNYVQNVLNESK